MWGFGGLCGVLEAHGGCLGVHGGALGASWWVLGKSVAVFSGF